MKQSFITELQLIKRASRDYATSPYFGKKTSFTRVMPAPRKPSQGPNPRLSQGAMPFSDYIKELERRYPDSTELATLKKMNITGDPLVVYNKSRNVDAFFSPRFGRIMSNHYNPLTMAHEFGHYQDFQDKYKYAPDYDPDYDYGPKSQAALDMQDRVVTDEAMKGKGFPAARLAESLRMEQAATQKALAAYEPYQRYLRGEKITPRESEFIGDLLASQTSYYHTDKDPRNPNTLDRESLRFRDDAITGSRQSKAKSKKIMDKIDDLYGLAGEGKVSGKFRDRLIKRYRKLLNDVGYGAEYLMPEGATPFSKKGMWKNMSRERRYEYIDHIVGNREILSKNFGPKAGKLYMSEMMKALRKML